MNNSNGMYRFFSEGIHNGILQTCIDLAECDGLDSTFMGTLLLIHEDAIEKGGTLYLINVSEYNQDKLKELGVGHLLDIEHRENIPELDLDELPDDNEEHERMSLILRAHEELIKKNKCNEEKFGLFIKSLKESFKPKSND